MTVQGERGATNKESFLKTIKDADQKRQSVSEAMRRAKEEESKKRLSSVTYKLKTGKKLTFEEMEILRVHAPELYREALMIMRRREELERRMKDAKTKREVEVIRASAIATVSGGRSSPKDGGEADIKLITANQLTDAYREYTKTAHYKNKPNFSSVRKDEFEENSAE
ncbi:MAG: hypothetical protein LBI38_01560 [Oscillospiraceae bacterium]|jgi:hypothetical protein|nr:hypothetical protein [Oscillospiraceae bacterium]